MVNNVEEAAQAPRSTTTGVLLLLAAAGLWSLSGLLIKLLYDDGEGISGLTIACYRSLLGGILFVPLAARQLRTLRNAPLSWTAGSVFAFTLMTVCFVIATTRTAAANAIILQNTSPVWVFLLSAFWLGERPRREEWIAMTLALAGVAIIFFGNSSSDITGLVVALASGLGYGSLTVALRGLRTVHPSVIVCINFLGSGLLLVGTVLLWGSFALTVRQAQVMVFLSVVQFALPYIFFSMALQTVEAPRASLIVLIESLLNPLWTYLIIHEPVPSATLIGGPLILASVAGGTLYSLRTATKGNHKGHKEHEEHKENLGDRK